MENQLKPNIFFVGATHPERKLFDEFMKLDLGTSYNSYLIIGNEKTALIDTVDPCKQQALVDNIKALNIQKIDYIISNHAEQDHAGSIPKILELFPDAKVVANEKCKTILQHELQIKDDKFMIIDDRQILSLGDKTLEFIFAPWVHWPETMFTYLREDKILFSGDLFGSHIAFEEVFSKNDKTVHDEAKRYFASIMLPFRGFIRNHLETLKSINISIIAPAHGPIYQDQKFIFDLHQDWASEEPKNKVAILFVSMHQSTEAMSKKIEELLRQRGIDSFCFDIVHDLDQALIVMADAKTIILASPTFFAGPHPAMVHAAYLINCLKPKAKHAAIIGSKEWGGKMAEHLKSMFTFYKPEIIDTVMARGFPDEKTINELVRLADTIAEKHK